MNCNQIAETPSKGKIIGLRAGVIHTGRSYQKLRQAALEGQFPIVRFNPAGKIYVKPEDLDAWISRNTIKSIALGGCE